MAGPSFGQSTASYLDGISPSFKQSLTSGVTATEVPGITDTVAVSELDTFINAEFGIDETGQFDSVADALTGTGALGGGQSEAWTFITAPEDVSWDVSNNATRVDIFGTNNPPVVAGSRGMRDLKLGNALVEGFVRGVNVEGKVAALEALMNYKLNPSDGFVSVPVYQVWANNKSYGGSEGYFIIKDVNVKETMRDTTGNSTRAYVDISLMQVPKYQVNSGRDQAGQVTAGDVALTPEQKAQAEAAQNKSGAAANAQQNAKTPAAATAAGQSGANAGGAATTAPKPPEAVRLGQEIQYQRPPNP
jgi:hypothetical protein